MASVGDCSCLIGLVGVMGHNRGETQQSGLSSQGGAMGGRLFFRLALAAALVSICLIAYVIAHAQSGPSWEVPVAVTMELQRYPVVAMGLAIVALLLKVWSNRLIDVGERANGALAVVLTIAFIYPFMVWLLKPEQWPYQFETLSFLASVIFVPVVIVSVVFFWLIGFRWVKKAESK